MREADVHGLDAHFLSADGKWRGDVQLAKSDVDDSRGTGGWANFSYTPRRGTKHQLALDYLDDKFDINDFGFLQRNDLIGARYAYNWTKSTGMRRFRNRTGSLSVAHWVNKNDHQIRGGYFYRDSWMFHNRSEIRTELNYFPSRWEDLESRGNGEYKIRGRWAWDFAYGTDTSKKVSFSAQIGGQQLDLRGWRHHAGLGITYKPVDGFSLDFDLNYRHHEAWLLHQQDEQFTSFQANDWQPRVALDFFLSAKHQVRFTLQWAGIVADAEEYLRLPAGQDELIVASDLGDADDFTISRLTTQLRYRWEIAPLSDLFVVYTRGSNLDNRFDDGFGALFTDALSTPVIDLFTIKLRYRFG